MGWYWIVHRRLSWFFWVMILSRRSLSPSVQSLSHVRLFATPLTAAHQASLSITNSWSLLKLMSIESVMPSNHLILCHPLLFLPSSFPSIRVFSNETVLHISLPKYWRRSLWKPKPPKKPHIWLILIICGSILVNLPTCWNVFLISKSINAHMLSWSLTDMQRGGNWYPGVHAPSWGWTKWHSLCLPVPALTP